MTRTGTGRVDVGPRWIRHRPDRVEARKALLAALGAGLAAGATVAVAVLYFSRLVMPRERIDPLEAPRRTRSALRGEGAGA